MNSKDNFSNAYNYSWNYYDLLLNLVLLGQDKNYRSKALKMAGLKSGDTVLDLCCGSGLSFKPVQEIISPSGKIIAVDDNLKMLSLAKRRAQKNGWNNIEFIHANIAEMDLSIEVDFVLFAYCWYDKEQGTNWVNIIKKSIKKKNDLRMCFIDHKLPDIKLVKYISIPIIWILLKLLHETYTINDLIWNPKEEIGTLLKEMKYKSFYLDSIIAVTGKIDL